MTGPEIPATVWRTGRLDARRGAPQLLFGWMYEDWTIEAELFAARSRVFAIASAGCTSLALASRGLRVTAVDVNPAQVEYVHARLAGAPAQAGEVERMLARLRRVLYRLGPREAEVRAFLALEDTTTQVRFFRERLDSPLLRGAAAIVFSRAAMRLAYASPFVRSLPPRFGRVLRARFARGFAMHPNRTNPYAFRFLLGEDLSEAQAASPPAGSLTVHVADAADYLESCAPRQFDAFTLSNILDAAPPAYGQRLLAAVERAAAPGAVVVLRSLSEPADENDRRWAARDRAGLWGSIAVRTV
jgi:S-adenosylmethionine:diacylglycerol 3-amino-3-carboxypropyl transferase